MVNEVCERLKKGAELGCTGEGKWPSVGKNNKSAYEEGKKMEDFMYGPFKAREMPWKTWKTSPVTMKPMQSYWNKWYFMLPRTCMTY